MTREMGVFPYSSDGVEAPRTDGTLSSKPEGPDTDIDLPTTLEPDVKNRGTVIKGTIGNTDYVFANKVSHGVFAGDS